ncbi:mitochondrial S-adenosylmethionine carrier protein-like [Saccoglossus kowalevskii]
MANTGFQEISEKPPTFSVALTAGAFGGIIESVLLFPLDTLKTRLQSEAGFSKSGGFKRCYSVGVFFCVYESVKNKFSGFEHNKYHPLIHAGAGCLAEVIACTVGVPAEVVKQRTQANIQLSGMQILRKTLQKEGVSGLYRGYTSTVLREVTILNQWKNSLQLFFLFGNVISHTDFVYIKC